MPIKTPGVPQANWEKICSRWQGGDTMTAIGRDYGADVVSIKKILKELNAFERVKRAPKKIPRTGTGKDLQDFTKSARSILWRRGTGKEHQQFEEWQDRIAALSLPEGGDLAKGQAIVQASKDFQCLRKLFREYDVRDYDPHKDSHPGIEHWGDAENADTAEEEVIFDGAENGYRENLRWAMEAAGEHLNTRKHPTHAPNGTAWYMYRQAKDEPKDFMAKFMQMESKIDDNRDDDLKRESRRTIEEIHEFLEELEEFEGSENEEKSTVETPQSIV